LAKIAVKLEPGTAQRIHDRAHARPARRVLACGEGWNVSDVICSAGPQQHPFEEQHSDVCIAIVVAGTFQYRSSAGGELMTPGSLLLGNQGQYFECRHDHGVGDRCISFSYEPRYFETLQSEAGFRRPGFSRLRVPPVRELSRLVARACARLQSHGSAGRARNTFAAPTPATHSFVHSSALAEWEEIGVEVAARALEFAAGGELPRNNLPAAEARVTRVVRMIESQPDVNHGLDSLAREAKLSRYHFLRIFQQLTGLTPHQYVLRARLRRAATRLILEPDQVLAIALSSGFGDVSNFNHSFRAEFGVSPRSYRRMHTTTVAEGERKAPTG
jgi:AraC family transcriptional regulator